MEREEIFIFAGTYFRRALFSRTLKVKKVLQQKFYEWAMHKKVIYKNTPFFLEESGL